MNETVFTSTAKRSARGISYTIFANGVEIGSRSTQKTNGYAFAYVARVNHHHTLKVARLNLDSQRAHLKQYSGYLANPQAWLDSQPSAFHRECNARALSDGSVARWVANCQASIKNWLTEIAHLEASTQASPRFSKWGVISYANKLRQSAQPWHYDFQHIILNQPQPPTT
jgi:hypothetical protein